MGRVTGPNDIKMTCRSDEIYALLEKAFAENNYSSAEGIVNVVIQGEFSAEDRQKVATSYRNAGWDFVSHVTTFELGKPPGATMFTFIKI